MKTKTSWCFSILFCVNINITQLSYIVGYCRYINYTKHIANPLEAFVWLHGCNMIQQINTGTSMHICSPSSWHDCTPMKFSGEEDHYHKSKNDDCAKSWAESWHSTGDKKWCEPRLARSKENMCYSVQVRLPACANHETPCTKRAYA